MAIQLPATCTTARRSSSRTSWACWESSMRVEGSSRPARICCQSSARFGDPAVAVAWGIGSGWGAGSGWTGVWGRGAGWGAGAGWTAAGFTGAGLTGAGLTAAGLAGARTTASASRPSNSTSSQRRGLTLWRSCCSLPLSWACHCSSRALPMVRASSGSSPRNWAETPVSSSRSGAAPASTRSRSKLTNPCSTAPGSRPRSSSSRQPSNSPRGSAPARARARASSSCSGTAPSSSHTAVASIGAGSRLSWSSRLSASRRPPWARWATTCRASGVMPIDSRSAIQPRCCSRACRGMRRKSKRWQRLRIVASTRWGSVVASTNTTRGGGSSSVLSRALKAAVESMWHSSTT